MRTTEPTTIAQGERIEWSRTFCDFPASDYDLQYRFRGVGPGADVAATANGDAFDVALTAAQSAAFGIGKYKWQAWVTEQADSTNTFIVGSGTATVERGFESGETGDIDLRTAEKIALDAINSALANAATSDQLEYEISTPAGSRKIKRMTRSELIALRKDYAAIVSRQNLAEKLRNGGKFGTPVKATMSEQ